MQLKETKTILTHELLVTRMLVIKRVCQDANMTSLLVMELTAAMGAMLANSGIVSLAWISI